MRNVGGYNQDPNFSGANRRNTLLGQVERYMRRILMKKAEVGVGRVESEAEITSSTGEIIGRNAEGYVAVMGTMIDGHPDDGGTLSKKKDTIPYPQPDDETVFMEPHLPRNAVRRLHRFSSVVQVVEGGGGNIAVTPDQVTEVYQINPAPLEELPIIPPEKVA